MASLPPGAGASASCDSPKNAGPGDGMLYMASAAYCAVFIALVNLLTLLQALQRLP